MACVVVEVGGAHETVAAGGVGGVTSDATAGAALEFALRFCELMISLRGRVDGNEGRPERGWTTARW